MKTVKILVLAAALALAGGCKKKQEPAKKDTGSATMQGSGSGSATPDSGSGSGSGSATAGSGSATPDSGSGSGSGSAAATPTEDTADWVKVYATHFEKKPEVDPVEVKFDKIKVTKASFDPTKIEGGTASLEIDLASLKSPEPKRDEHLKTPDYLDVAKFATATVDIDNVKKKDEKTFTADAKVKLHGVEKKVPVTFEVVEAKDDWIRVKGETTIKRLDFKIGKKPGPDMKKGDDGTNDELPVKLQLTLKKT